MELRRFWLLSDLLEKSPSARELRRGGFCGGNGADIFILFSVSPSPSPSAACSSMLTNDGMEALAQSLRRRYLPLSMMLMLSGYRFCCIYRLTVKRCKYCAILIKPLCVCVCFKSPKQIASCAVVPQLLQSGRACCPNNGLQLPSSQLLRSPSCSLSLPFSQSLSRSLASLLLSMNSIEPTLAR